jgi:biopolymer transport protein ExbD
MQFERNRRGSGDINITPLIDMVFLLLIFFLLTSSFIIDRGIKINLPKAVSSETAHDNRITVAIDSAGAVFVDNEPVLIESLPDKLKKAYAEKDTKTIYLKADKQNRVDILVRVMDIIKQSGSEKMNLITEAKQKSTSGNPL